MNAVHLAETALDGRALRGAPGCFATGVAVVTAWRPDGAPAGPTVHSCASVPLDPPLMRHANSTPSA